MNCCCCCCYCLFLSKAFLGCDCDSSISGIPSVDLASQSRMKTSHVLQVVDLFEVRMILSVSVYVLESDCAYDLLETF